MTTTLTGSCFEGAVRIRPLSAAERWQQYVQVVRARRIRRQRAAAAKGRVERHLERK